MSMILEDLRYAVRALRSRPSLSAVVVVTLALGIGANSAIFTVVNGVLLRPLPFTNPDRVVMMYEVDPRGRDSIVSLPLIDDWRRQLTTLTGISAVAVQSANLTNVAEPDRLRAAFVSAGFFDTLGVQPAIGRGFREGEDLPGAMKTAVLSYATWQSRFGGDPSVLGRSLVLNNEPHQVIGVLSATFEFPIDATEVWMPLASFPNLSATRRDRGYMVVGRIRNGMSDEAATAELRALSTSLASAYPDTNAQWSARLVPFREAAIGGTASNLRMLSGAAAFVLLIACANIANLLLVRATSRQREMALRAALGASRARLVRQLLAESALMALAGGGLGLVLSASLTEAMLQLVPLLPRGDRVAPDAAVVAFTLLVSTVTGLLFGSAPAWRISRTDVRSTLNESVRTGDSRGAAGIRSALIVCELALSLVLLVGAGLMVQSLYRVLTVDIGYQPDHLLTLEYRLPRNKYQTAAEQWGFHRRVVEAIAGVPGVETASLARAAAQSGNGGYVGYWRADQSQPSQDSLSRAQFNAVTSDYFRAMRIPIVQGRVCNAGDTADAPIAIVINHFLADRLWPGQNAIGEQLRSPDIPVAANVVGVVGNTRPQLLSQPITSQIYGCLSQQAGLFATVVARTTAEPMAVARAVQRAVWTVDPDQPVWKIRSAESMVAGSVQTQRFVMVLMSSAAALALLLAALGTYSVLSYSVERRAREVGVRLALGATRSRVIRLMLSQTSVLIAIGVVVGLAGAFVLADVLATQLFEISPRDPLTFVATAALLTVVALIAAWMPVSRATRVDPALTLRAE
jgi:putative ABC transport system permease protein